MKEHNEAKYYVTGHIRFYEMSLDKLMPFEKRCNDYFALQIVNFIYFLTLGKADGDSYEMMQRKYRYRAKFNDITTGAKGIITVSDNYF